jgi:hypothetical protein
MAGQKRDRDLRLEVANELLRRMEAGSDRELRIG